MEVEEISQKLETILTEYKTMQAEKESLQTILDIYKATVRNQEEKLNNIYESSAKAQYEAELWETRFNAIQNGVDEGVKANPTHKPFVAVQEILDIAKEADLFELKEIINDKGDY